MDAFCALAFRHDGGVAHIDLDIAGAFSNGEHGFCIITPCRYVAALNIDADIAR